MNSGTEDTSLIWKRWSSKFCIPNRKALCFDASHPNPLSTARNFLDRSKQDVASHTPWAPIHRAPEQRTTKIQQGATQSKLHEKCQRDRSVPSWTSSPAPRSPNTWENLHSSGCVSVGAGDCAWTWVGGERSGAALPFIVFSSLPRTRCGTPVGSRREWQRRDRGRGVAGEGVGVR
jgi:hypothetical protein